MDETLTEQLTQAAMRLAAAAEALENTLGRIDAQHQELNAKVERIVAAIDENLTGRVEPVADTSTDELTARIAELERVNADLKAQATRVARKTMSPLLTAILAKNEAGESPDSAVLDKAMASLSIEQRMAVKAEMARAGMIE